MLTMGGIVTTPERKASPVFTGEKLPVPPKQTSPWSPPPTDLPTNYISATKILFEQGMADPRGCDYHAIQVSTGNVWQGDGGVVSTHGWVLPGNAAQKFAVGWNGMVYPVVSVGTNADLEADVAMLETNGFSSWGSAIPEPMSVSHSSMLGLKGCFLLRLGKTDLAIRLWLAQERRGRSFQNEMMRRFSETNGLASTNEIKLSDADPYLGWATDWAWAMFDRTICAHERGDEKLALLTARQLAVAQPQIEAECVKRGFKRQPNWNSRQQKDEQPYLTFLGQLPELLADLERRDQEGPHVSIISTGITNLTDQSQRIARLIRDLDLNGARQWGQPGGVNLAGDAIVSALIDEGDAAVEPLLDCLAHDQRLTRSVSFGRDFHRERTVHTVRSAAQAALQAILQASFFGSAAEMRAYWSQYKSLKLADRWYEILKDETATNRWLETAANLVRPENVPPFPGGYLVTPPPLSNAPVKLHGEILRAKFNPTVTELLTRHVLEVPTNHIGSYDLAASCQLADYLAQWDAPAALPVAKILSKRARTVMKYSRQQLGSFVAKLSLARAQAGDPQAFDDYADWIVTTTPEQLDYRKLELEPFKKFPTNLLLMAAAEKMFADTNSAWGQLPWQGSYQGEIFAPGLFDLPAFRTLLARELTKTNDFGNVTWRENNYLEYRQTNSSGGFSLSFPENGSPTNGTVAQIRWCDWIAIGLASQNQIPFYNPFAPIAERDQKLSKARIRLLKK